MADLATEESKAIAEAKKKAGNEAFASNDYEEGIRLYSEAITLDGTNHVYFSNRSACYAAQGKHTEAAEDAKQCVKLKPDFVKGYYRLSTSLLALGEHDQALEAVNLGLAVEPKSSDLARQLRLVKAKRAASASAARKNVKMDRQTFEEYQELQEQLAETQRELAEVESSMMLCVREGKRAELTMNEVGALPQGTRTYQSVGKIFILNDRDEIQDLLKKQTGDRESKLKQLESKQKYLTNRVKSQKAGIEELIKTLKADAS
ncbi:unnamed protein product [Chrysoparadoxa australica]